MILIKMNYSNNSKKIIMKKLIICLFAISALLSCQKIDLVENKASNSNLPLTKSGIPDPPPATNGYVIDGVTGGNGQMSAYGVFAYPTGWCQLYYNNYACKVDWTNGVPSVTDFDLVYDNSGITVIGSSAYFTVPEEEITVYVLYNYSQLGIQDYFTFKIDIPNSTAIIEGAGNPYSYLTYRTYDFSSLNRYYNISFVTNTTNNTIGNINVNLNSHPYFTEPTLTYTYTISGNQVEFVISGSLLEEVLLPNGMTSIVELTFNDTFTMGL